MLEIALTTFATLFVIIDPIGLTPIFVALTSGLPAAQRKAIAARACFIGMVVLALFGLGGEKLLSVIGIGMPAFRIAGGLLLFLIAVEMLFDRRSQRRGKQAEPNDEDHAHDPSVFPLATPLIAGPGALATMILLTHQHDSWATKFIIIGIMAVVVLSVFVMFRLSGLLEKLLGQVGINVVTRLLGMLLAALSIQFVIDGLRGAGFLALSTT